MDTPFYQSPVFWTLVTAFVLNVAYAVVNYTVLPIDPGIIIAIDAGILSLANQLHVNIVNQKVAAAVQKAQETK